MMPNLEDDPSKLFGHVYLRPAKLLDDSKALRVRLYRLCESWKLLDYKMVEKLEEKLGNGPGTTGMGWAWRSWFEVCQLRHLLGAVQLFCQRKDARGADFSASRARAVQQIMDEEHLAYFVRPDGAVRYRADQEYQRTTEATIAALQRPEFDGARHEFERGQRALCQAEPDGKTAVQATFESAEVLFKLTSPR